MPLPPFEMERWQSLHEHEVEYNLSESGVHPFTLRELEELTGISVGDVRLAYTQTNGTPELRERIAALYPGATADHVLVTTGGAEANFLALWELLSAGDRVVILVPTYGQTPGLAEGLGAEVRTVALEEARGWQPDPEALAAAIRPGTRLVVVTNPNNPTGAVLSREAHDAIARAAAEAGCWVLSDEVYAGAELVDGGPTADLEEAPETESLWRRVPRVLASGSLSKAYGLPGLRLGWLVGPRERIARLWARKDYTTIAPTALSDRLATAALEPDARRSILARTRRIVRDNLGTLEGWLEGHPDLFRWRRPDAGAICWLAYRLDEVSGRLADDLRREEGVLVVPGDQFGMDGYLRIGFGIEPSELRAALDRTAGFLGRRAG